MAAIFGYTFEGNVLVLGAGASLGLMFVLLSVGLIASLVVTGYVSKNGGGKNEPLASLPVAVMVTVFAIIIGTMFQTFY